MPKTAEVTFSGSIPENYDKYLGPLMFVPSAQDLARRLPATGLNDVLELACGTGILTQILRERLGEATKLTATDLSEGMIKVAKTKTIEKKVDWKVVDATTLPFKDGSFDVVVCQYGVMFFPDKEKAMSEIFRVLRPGGRLLFNVWDKLKYNELPRIAHGVIEKLFDGNPPTFYQIPFGFNDHFVIRSLLRGAGFNDVGLTTLEMKFQAKPEDAAMGYIEGNPILDEIKKLGKDVTEVRQAVERAIASELGSKMAKGKGQAIVVGARKPMSASTPKQEVHAKESKPKPEVHTKEAKPKPASKKPGAKAAKPKPATKK